MRGSESKLEPLFMSYLVVAIGFYLSKAFFNPARLAILSADYLKSAAVRFVAVYNFDEFPVSGGATELVIEL